MRRAVLVTENIPGILPEEEFRSVFEGLGVMKEEYTIRLTDDARPHAESYRHGGCPFPYVTP